MIKSNDSRDAFLREFLPARDAIMSYILSMVPSYPEAEDLFQDVSLVLWKDFGRFRPGSNFLAWARKTAWHRVMNERRRVKHEVPWDPAVMEVLDAVFEEQSGRLVHMREALKACLTKLPSKSREIVDYKYGQRKSLADIGRILKQSVGGLKVHLHRIRRKLAECIEKEMKIRA